MRRAERRIERGIFVEQNRFKSWGLWLSVAALVVYVVKTIWKVDILQTVDGLLNVLLPVLMAFGIINNPTDKTHL